MKIVRKVTLIAFLWIAVINSGQLGSLDTALRLHMAHAWWTGTEEVSPNYKPKERGEIAAGVRGVGGKRYIAYDVGQSLLMLPGDWLGTQIQQVLPTVKPEYLRYVMVNLVIFIPLNVAAVVSCFWLLRLFNFQERIAGLTSIAWLLGTTVLSYAQVPFQNNQLLLLVTIGYATALAYIRYGRPRFAMFSGLSLAGAFLIRMTSIIHTFTVLLFLVGCIAYQSRNTFKVLRGVGLWIVGFIPLFLLGRGFDTIRYGSFWITGQRLATQQLNTDPIWSGLPELPANYPFINEPYVGILGVLFSPAKSIFLYDPLLLPCLVLGVVFWKRLSPYIQWYLVTITLDLGLHMVLTSRMDFWHGDWAWASRYHVTSIHLLLIPLVALFIERLLLARRLSVWLMRGILTVAIAVQIASVTLPYHLEIAEDNALDPNFKTAQTPAWMVKSRLQFRLGQRFTNIVCLLDRSFSEGCINRLNLNPGDRYVLENYNRPYFLPFGLSAKVAGSPTLAKISLILLVVWGLVLTLAIAITVRFVFFEVV